MVKSKERKLRPHGPDLAEHLVILKVNLGIQAKAFADGPDGGRFRRERVGHILPGGKVVGFVGEFAAAGVFRGGDVGAFFLHRGGYGADQLLDGSFRTLHVEYDKSFVISHGLVIIRNVSCERCAPCGQVRCNDCLQKASLFFTLFTGTCRFLRFIPSGEGKKGEHDGGRCCFSVQLVKHPFMVKSFCMTFLVGTLLRLTDLPNSGRTGF